MRSFESYIKWKQQIFGPITRANVGVAPDIATVMVVNWKRHPHPEKI